MIFSFGARRSGTWWLQRIIAAHPTVAPVPSESFFFSSGIAPLFESFQHVDRDSPSTGRIWSDREVLLDATRDFCDRIFEQFAEGPASRIAERTPWHVRHLELMNAIYPDAYYVHIVRDGRDSARSLASMDWFDGTLEDAAAEWRESVLAARDGNLPERYLEVRYEDLLSEPESRIRKLYDFLDLELDAGVLEAALAEARVEANMGPRGGVATEKWRQLMSPREQAVVLEIAGDALAHYGYEPEPAVDGARAGANGASRPLLRRLRGPQVLRRDRTR